LNGLRYHEVLSLHVGEFNNSAVRSDLLGVLSSNFTVLTLLFTYEASLTEIDTHEFSAI